MPGWCDDPPSIVMPLTRRALALAVVLSLAVALGVVAPASAGRPGPSRALAQTLVVGEARALGLVAVAIAAQARADGRRAAEPLAYVHDALIEANAHASRSRVLRATRRGSRVTVVEGTVAACVGFTGAPPHWRVEVTPGACA